MKLSRHYLGLALMIVIGTALRFWNLDLKPLWLDEVITALFTLGKSYKDIPLNTVFPLSNLAEIFSFNFSIGCPQIAENIATQSTHPPLFFCLMHYWLAQFSHAYSLLAMNLRSLPAIFGVGAIVATYYLNRIAFSAKAGLIAAAFMAVSPFGVYISQEARHYTLPVLLITLSLLCLIQIIQDFQQPKWRPIVWLSWVIVNTVGLYVHYFFILALIGEIITLFLLFCQVRFNKNFSQYFTFPLPISPILPIIFWLLPFIFFIPWITVLTGHFERPETSWLPSPENIAPLYQILAAWLLMAIALPVENQPLWLAVPAASVIILFGIWVGWQIFPLLKQIWHNQTTNIASFTLVFFIFCVLLQFLAIIYLLGKDISVAPRYNFVYYPAICALIGAAIANRKPVENNNKFSPFFNLTLENIILFIGILSSIFVCYGLVFVKPYQPQKVAQDMLREPNIPLIVVMGYNDFQDVALGLSFALAIDNFSAHKCSKNLEICPKMAFYNRITGYKEIWQHLSELSKPAKLPLNLWMIAPGLKSKDFPVQLAFSNQVNCTIDPKEYYRIGIPYQLYRCQ